MEVNEELGLSVFRIITGPNKSGTCFLYPFGDGFAFVTAQHVLGDCCAGDKIFLASYDNTQQSFILNQRLNGLSNYDICIFTLDDFECSKFSEQFLRVEGIHPGSPVRMLGFPHGMRAYAGHGARYAPPLIKSGVLSGQIFQDNRMFYVVDIISNGGNSGGPVVTLKYNDTGNGYYVLVGVVTEFIPEKPDKTVIVSKETGKVSPNYDIISHSGMSMIVPGHIVRDTFTINSQNLLANDFTPAEFS